jgi:hypothetical protein
MLFKPEAQDGLAGVLALLDGWNGEADAFRAAAAATHNGGAPSSSLVEAAEGMHDGLLELMADIDEALERLPPGHREFAALLRAQNMALNLIESVGNSLDVLERYVATPMDAPRRIEHRAARLDAAQ